MLKNPNNFNEELPIFQIKTFFNLLVLLGKFITYHSYKWLEKGKHDIAFVWVSIMIKSIFIPICLNINWGFFNKLVISNLFKICEGLFNNFSWCFCCWHRTFDIWVGLHRKTSSVFWRKWLIKVTVNKQVLMKIVLG